MEISQFVGLLPDTATILLDCRLDAINCSVYRNCSPHTTESMLDWLGEEQRSGRGRGFLLSHSEKDGVCSTLSGNQVTKPRNDHSNCVCMCVRAIRPATLTAGCAMLSRIQPLLLA